MAQLDDQTFQQVQGTSVSIKVSDDLQTFKLTDAAGADLGRFPIAELKHVVKRMPPTLTDLTFHYNTNSQPPGAEDYARDFLLTLDDFKVLDLTVGKLLSHEEAIVKLLTHNSTLESCTLRVHPSETVLRKILLPFMFGRVEDEKNRALVKKLVLVSIAPGTPGTPIEHVLKQVIDHNTVLEHLEVGDGVFAPSAEGTDAITSTSLKADAIRRNKALKVIRFQCTSKEFKEIVSRGGLVPGDSTPNTTLKTSTPNTTLRPSTPNTTLRTLRVSLHDSEKLDWEDLVKLVASTRTLEHVEVSQGPKDTKLKLQRLCDKELMARKRASSGSSNAERELQSVTVGSWKAALKVDKWEITDTGSVQ